MLRRRRRRHALALVLVLAIAAACGGGGDEKATPTSAGDGSTTTAATGRGTSSTTAAPGDDDPTAGVGTTSSTTAASTGTGDDTGSTVRYPEEGDYRYDVDGTFTVGASSQPLPETATLTVENLSATDQRHTQSAGDARSESVYRVRRGALLLVRLETDQGGITKEFRPDPPVVFAPHDLGIGDAWSWKMTSTDGKTTVEQSSRAVRREQVNVGGRAVDTLVVETSIRITGDIEATTEQTTWGSIKHRLAVKTSQTTRGRFGAIAFRSQSTSVLRSLAPA